MLNQWVFHWPLIKQLRVPGAVRCIWREEVHNQIRYYYQCSISFPEERWDIDCMLHIKQGKSCAFRMTACSLSQKHIHTHSHTHTFRCSNHIRTIHKLRYYHYKNHYYYANLHPTTWLLLFFQFFYYPDYNFSPSEFFTTYMYTQPYDTLKEENNKVY